MKKFTFVLAFTLATSMATITTSHASNIGQTVDDTDPKQIELYIKDFKEDPSFPASLKSELAEIEKEFIKHQKAYKSFIENKKTVAELGADGLTKQLNKDTEFIEQYTNLAERIDELVANKELVKTGGKTVFVNKKYTYISTGYHDIEELKNSRNAMAKAISENETVIGSATFLIENTPQTIVKVRAKLDKLLKDAKNLQKQAKNALAEYDDVLKEVK